MTKEVVGSLEAIINKKKPSTRASFVRTMPKILPPVQLWGKVGKVLHAVQSLQIAEVTPITTIVSLQQPMRQMIVIKFLLKSRNAFQQISSRLHQFITEEQATLVFIEAIAR